MKYDTIYSRPIAGQKQSRSRLAAGHKQAGSKPQPSYKQARSRPGGNGTEIAKLHTKHISDFGGYYFADCVVALKGSRPLPAPPDRRGLGDVKELLKCIVPAWSLTITLHVVPYDDMQTSLKTHVVL